MTKHIHHILLLAIGLLAPAMLQAAPYHAFGLWVEGSYSQMVTKMPTVSAPKGGSVGGGLAYEIKTRGLMIQTGLGIRFQDVRSTAADTAFTWEGVLDNDPLNPKYVDVHYSFYDHHDRARNWYFELPILFGTFFGASGYNDAGQGYFLAGPKLRVTIGGETRSQTVGTTTGTYADYIGEWAEMDGHGFRRDVPIATNLGQLPLGIDIGAHAEVGYEYGRENMRSYGYSLRPLIRIAAFVDFGMINCMPARRIGSDIAQGLVEVPEATMYDFPTYRVNHAFRTVGAKDYWLHNLFVGVKFTVLLRLPNHDGCVICNEERYGYR